MKKMITIISLVVTLLVGGYALYYSQNNMKLSDLALANIEAIAEYESPDFVITCNQSKRTSPGACWVRRGECFTNYLRWDDCEFTGSTYNKCTSICPL